VLDIIVLNIGIGFLSAGGRVVSIYVRGANSLFQDTKLAFSRLPVDLIATRSVQIFCLIPYNFFVRALGGFAAYLPRRLELSRYAMTLQSISTFLCFALIFMTFAVHDLPGVDPENSPRGGIRTIGFSTFSMYFIVSLVYSILSSSLRTTYLDLDKQLRLQRLAYEVDDGRQPNQEVDVELEEPEAERVAEIPRNSPQPQPAMAVLVAPGSRQRRQDPPRASLVDIDEIRELAAASVAAERMSNSSWVSSGKDSSPSSSLENSRFEASSTAQDAPLPSTSTPTPDFAQSDEAGAAIFGALERQFPVGSSSLLEEVLD
jgi:hypothetical protein